MNVILLDNVENLGKIGDLVKVKPGYGRNYLVPGKKAVPATADNVKVFEERRAELEKAAAEALAAAQARAEKLAALENVVIPDIEKDLREMSAQIEEIDQEDVIRVYMKQA